MSEFYLDERQRKKQRWLLKLKIYSGLVVFLLLIIGIAYVIIYSPVFQIKNIYISADGAQVNIDELVQKLKIFFANQSKIVSFLAADNILIWNSKNLDQFKKSPEIANLTIEKDYFSRHIKIIVSEREKFGVWCEADNKCYWFDKNGVLFSEAPPAEGNLINKVDDYSGRPLKIGDSILEEKLLLNLIKIFDVLEKSDLGIKSLKLERLELQEISTESSPKIYFSLRIDPGFALSVIKSLKSGSLDKIEYIDLRVENRAYYKMK